MLGAAGTAVDASCVAAAVVAVEAVSALVGGAVDCVQPTSASIIVPRMLATAGRNGAATTRLWLTVFTSVECLARSESFVSDRMRSMRCRPSGPYPAWAVRLAVCCADDQSPCGMVGGRFVGALSRRSYAAQTLTTPTAVAWPGPSGAATEVDGTPRATLEIPHGESLARGPTVPGLRLCLIFRTPPANSA